MTQQENPYVPFRAFGESAFVRFCQNVHSNIIPFTTHTPNLESLVNHVSLYEQACTNTEAAIMAIKEFFIHDYFRMLGEVTPVHKFQFESPLKEWGDSVLESINRGNSVRLTNQAKTKSARLAGVFEVGDLGKTTKTIAFLESRKLQFGFIRDSSYNLFRRTPIRFIKAIPSDEMIQLESRPVYNQGTVTGKTSLQNYLSHPNNFVLALSGGKDFFEQLYGKIHYELVHQKPTAEKLARTLERDTILKSIEYHATFFHDQSLARSLLTDLYSRVCLVHRHLITLAAPHFDRIRQGTPATPEFHQISQLILERENVEEYIASNAKNIYKKISHFGPGEQIRALQDIVDNFPFKLPDTIDRVGCSVYGRLQFPKGYFGVLAGAMNFIRGEARRAGTEITPRWFHQQVRRVINEHTNLGGEIAENSEYFRKKILPGSYESGKR